MLLDRSSKLELHSDLSQTPVVFCRGCGRILTETFVDLRASPLANAYLEPHALGNMEPFYPLHVFVCSGCFLAQLQSFETPDAIFSDYPYFSSYSSSWLDHARAYVKTMIGRRNLGPTSHVVEIASNDGYLLQYFVAAGVPVLGVEPALNIAAVAIERGIPTESAFFGAINAQSILTRHGAADLIVGNNVLAHVPDLHDFVSGVAILLADDGLATFEFPHLLRLIDEAQFDTIYHEHFSYFSLLAVEPVFERHGLRVVDVDELSTHGGSLRLHVARIGASGSVAPAVAALRTREVDAGLCSLRTYRMFGESVKRRKRELLRFLIDAADAGKTVAGYGAPAKGNTLLNYCGVGPDLLPFTVDRSPRKQGRFLPGCRIPIYPPEHLVAARPDFVLILPWNLRAEIVAEMSIVRSWGGQFIIPIPQLQRYVAAVHSSVPEPKG